MQLIKIGKRKCHVCKTIFPLTKDFFGKNNHQPNGLVYDCHKCHKIRIKTTPSYGKGGYDKFSKTLRYTRYKNNSKERGYTWSITKEEFEELWGSPCNYCNSEIETIGLDRVDNTKGYSKDNIISCCRKCNFMKGQLTKEEFINQCKLVTSKF